MAAEGLTPAQMADLVISVTNAYPMKYSFEYLRDASIHSFELMNRIFRDEKVMIQGGEYISTYVVYRENGTAEFVLPGKVYQPSITNVMKKVTIPWRHSHGHYSVLREELLGNRTPEKLVGIIKPRRQSTQYDMALLMEAQFWAGATAGSEVLPLTIPYFIVPITGAQVTTGTTLDGDFQGENPTGFSDVSGLDASNDTYSRWRNWNSQAATSTGAWTEVDEERMERTFLNLNFESPDNVEDLENKVFQNQKMYTNITTLLDMKRNAKQQNDQVGWDVSLDANKNVLWKGIRPKWQKQLDNANYSATRGYYPTYLVNYMAMFPVVREGEYFLEQTFAPDKSQPDMTTTHMDLSYNLLCSNRQSVGAVHSYVAAA